MEHPYQKVLALILWQFVVSQGVLKCPESTEDWGRASMALQCKDPNYYHCLKDENGQITQQCLQRVWIQQSMCPEFNFKARRIDVYQCKSNENNCPTTTYWSNAVYVYPGCFHIVSSTVLKSSTTLPTLPLTIEITTKNSTSANDTSSSENTSNAIPVMPIIISIISILIGVALLFLVIKCLVFRRRHRRDLVKNIKENKEGNKRIVFLPSHTTVDETTIAEAAKMLGEKTKAENDFNKWMKNKNRYERMYIFRDWIHSDQEVSIKRLKQTLIQVLVNVIEKDTKFIIMIPLSIWTKDQNLTKLLRECPLFKIRF
ncbi:uncharacterized protein LOC134239889 [Saccostrea cucullata]|uniref:uncharacterized protein LOC134239889 n=1 Tax=Saccostrea cuccullata TaxID=36930 RepID=UPI002ED3DE0C